MIANPYQQYQESQLETASQGKLLLMLYDGAIRFLTQAHQALEAKNYQESHKFITRAEDIITELMASLRMDVGGEIALNLYRLYEYFNWRLIQANIKRSPAMVLEVKTRMRELRDTWAEAIKLTSAQQSSTGMA